MPPTPDHQIYLNMLSSAGRGAPSLADKVRLLDELRKEHPRICRKVEAALLEQHTRMRKELHEAAAKFAEFETALQRLTTPPLHPAIYLGPCPGPVPMAAVAHGETRRMVPLAEEMDGVTLGPGDEVLLNQDLTVVVGRSSGAGAAFGETACFERFLGEDRMILRAAGDEQAVVGMSDAIRGEPCEHGDLVRWHGNARLALERIERPDLDEFLIESVPDLTPQCVGGHGAVIDELIRTVTIGLTRPDLAAQYHLDGQRAVLLIGPPGTGKTLMARVTAAEVRRLTGRECRICIVKPGQFEDPYVGVTQRRIRECFAAARRSEHLVVMFLDELETIGRTRGGVANHHRDVFLGALLAEIQGFDAGNDDNLAIIAATNRLDLIDPALAERMELQLEVNRPNRRAAAEIFAIHLGPDIPYAANGTPPDAMRRELIDRAVSSFYSPNAANTLCTIKFADNKTRTVTARELASGRSFAQVCQAARRRAALRHLEGGDNGLRPDDIDDAVAVTLVKQTRTLTRRNIHSYLADLPQDLDVVSVTPETRLVERPHEYLNGRAR